MESNDSNVQIIPYYAQPHVYTVIKDHTWYDETVAGNANEAEMPYSTVVVTGADSGIDNKFIRLTDYNTKVSIFGRGNYAKYGQPSIQADTLFNGATSVWFCRVLPDNANYANAIIMAYYKAGDQYDEDNNATGLQEMKIKFGISHAVKDQDTLPLGPVNDDAIRGVCGSLTQSTADFQTNYFAVPIAYIRATGRGRYGNNISVAITRDLIAENDYLVKMYDFNVINNSSTTNSTQVTNVLAGSLAQVIRNGVSTLISDVVDSYGTGSSPIQIIPFEESFETLFNFYKDEVVDTNAATIRGLAAPTDEQLADLKFAQGISRASFDPIFGMRFRTTADEQLPYYKNYTSKGEAWVDPDKTATTAVYQNTEDWTQAAVGKTLDVAEDAAHNGKRYRYTVRAINAETGAIDYDEGVELAPDAEEYDGENLAANTGFALIAGHDGDFEEIVDGVDGHLRKPAEAEMKLLLSKEFVRAFRGELDRKILSPARTNIDFIFDANYNMTSEDDIIVDANTVPLYSNSTILTNADAAQLTVLETTSLLANTDLNVKQAMYDLVTFRNKRGMTINPNDGAGCSLYLDMNLTGLSSLNVNYELERNLAMFSTFSRRATSIDMGYYEIFDPASAKRIKVTVGYFLASNLIPHLVQYGLNKPFTYDYAALRAIQSTGALSASGNMIRDTFKPDIDLIDWDLKEKLYKTRVNYYVSEDEGRTVKRACQNTRQVDASALLEENNVRVLNLLVKQVERDCQSYLYNWNEPAVREGFTKAQREKYRSWIGTYVDDLDIRFTANEWEQERMIMHCYVDVKFRDIIKRIIVEVNVYRPTGNAESSR